MTVSVKSNRLRAEFRTKNWDPYAKHKYKITQREIPGVGVRYRAIPNTHDTYEQLQSSRGVGLSDWNALVRQAKANKLSAFQMKLLRELDDYNRRLSIYRHDKGLVEIGFRYPALLSVFSSHFKFVRGYDVAPTFVAAAQELGWDVHLHDVSSSSSQLNLIGVGLIVAHEVLEHTPDPETALRKINTAEVGTFLHVSVPIQPGRPIIGQGHLSEFRSGDLSKMLKLSGWSVMGTSKVRQSEVILGRR